MYCASYGKGNIAVFRILEDGGLRYLCKIQHVGHGARPDRQSVPHCHFAGDRDGELFVADLGLDKVFKSELLPIFHGQLWWSAVRYFCMVAFAGAVWPLTFPLWQKVGAKKDAK